MSSIPIKLIGNHSISLPLYVSFKEIMKEVIRREKATGITPNPDVDTYMKVKHTSFIK
jgi:hypothetical protein